MKRIFLASALAISASRAGVAKQDTTQVMSHLDKELSDLSSSGLNKRGFSSPAAAFARSYGHYNFNKRSWSGKSRSEYEKVMQSTISQLKTNLNLLEQKTKGLPDEYVAGLISRLGETSRKTMGRLCKSGEVQSRMCRLIDDSLEEENQVKRSGGFSHQMSQQLPGRFFMKRSLLGHHSPLSHDEELFMKRSAGEIESELANVYSPIFEEDGVIPDDVIFQQKRSQEMSAHNAPKYMNYNSFPGADSINWGSLPGFGAKSAFNMPSKRSDAGYSKRHAMQGAQSRQSKYMPYHSTAFLVNLIRSF